MPCFGENVKSGWGKFPMFFRPPCPPDSGEEYPPVPRFPKPDLRSFPCDQSRPSKVRRSPVQNQRMKSQHRVPRPCPLGRVIPVARTYGRGVDPSTAIRPLGSWGFPNFQKGAVELPSHGPTQLAIANYCTPAVRVLSRLIQPMMVTTPSTLMTMPPNNPCIMPRVRTIARIA